jgi:osmotically-inducible protein OsmY
VDVTPRVPRSRRKEQMYTSLKRTIPAVILTGLCSLTSISVNAQTPADNTKVNARDRAKGAVTADQQKENATDRQVAKKIRQSLMNDKSLSTYAHNVKVVAQGGQVTLKGPVRSEEEKRSVEAKAVEIAGVGHVTNEISIAPADSDAPKN